MIEVPSILIVFAIIAVPVGAISIIANAWVASKAVQMMEERYAICSACPICVGREKQAREIAR